MVMVSLVCSVMGVASCKGFACRWYSERADVAVIWRDLCETLSMSVCICYEGDAHRLLSHGRK
jgi:hypothetical protein